MHAHEIYAHCSVAFSLLGMKCQRTLSGNRLLAGSLASPVARRSPHRELAAIRTRTLTRSPETNYTSIPITPHSESHHLLGNAGSKGLENVWTPQVRVQKASLIESEGGEEGQAQWWCGFGAPEPWRILFQARRYPHPIESEVRNLWLCQIRPCTSICRERSFCRSLCCRQVEMSGLSKR